MSLCVICMLASPIWKLNGQSIEMMHKSFPTIGCSSEHKIYFWRRFFFSNGFSLSKETTCGLYHPPTRGFMEILALKIFQKRLLYKPPKNSKKQQLLWRRNKMWELEVKTTCFYCRQHPLVMLSPFLGKDIFYWLTIQLRLCSRSYRLTQQALLLTCCRAQMALLTSSNDLWKWKQHYCTKK